MKDYIDKTNSSDYSEISDCEATPDSDALPCEVLAQGRYLRLIRSGHWEYVERTHASGAAYILAVTDEQELLLVEQYRRPVDARVIELPAGLVGDSDAVQHETLLDGARRELLEETGYQADSMEFLLEGPVAAAGFRGTVSMVRATGLRKVGPGGGDAEESITVHVVPMAKVAGFLREKKAQGAMVDLKVYAALFLAESSWEF